MLTTIGEMAKILEGQTFMQNYSKHALVEQWCMTSIDAQMKRKLSIWLSEFTEAAGGNKCQVNTEKRYLPLLASMLPSPVQSASTTYTSCMTADGRTAPVAAVPSATLDLLPSTNEESAISPLYHPKTSGFFRSMCFTKGKYRYSLKLPGIEGDYIVKLEIYKTAAVMGHPASDWWKNAEMRAFFLVRNNTQPLQAAINLQQEL